LKIPPTESYNIQIHKGTNSELTFEKKDRFQKRQNKNHKKKLGLEQVQTTRAKISKHWESILHELVLMQR